MPKVAKYDPEQMLKVDLPYITKLIHERNNPSAILYVLLMGMYPDHSFDVDDYDELAAELADYLRECEGAKREEHLQAIVDGKVRVDSESKLQAYISVHLDCRELEDENAQRLKAMRYEDFLATEYWSIIRSVIVTRNRGRCQLCPKYGRLNVHHRTYEHHGYEHKYLEDLICLCQSCHEKFHDKLPKESSRANV